jgi:hypothetical protein
MEYITAIHSEKFRGAFRKGGDGRWYLSTNDGDVFSYAKQSPFFYEMNGRQRLLNLNRFFTDDEYNMLVERYLRDIHPKIIIETELQAIEIFEGCFNQVTSSMTETEINDIVSEILAVREDARIDVFTQFIAVVKLRKLLHSYGRIVHTAKMLGLASLYFEMYQIGGTWTMNISVYRSLYDFAGNHFKLQR